MIREWILKWARNRQPDFIIGGSERPYLKRHWLLPRNLFFNIYVHQFLRSDDDRALHDHPWAFNCSWLLDGGYIEWVPGVGANPSPLHPVPRFRYAGGFYFRWGGAPHRVQLRQEGRGEEPCWTLFITGPRVREWGFYCPKGWIEWRKFVDERDAGAVGAGCEQ